MRIQLKFFAIVRDQAGVAESTLDLPDGATVSAAADAIANRFPGVAAGLARVAFAVNREYVGRAERLREGDELALIPPVSGG